MIKWTVDFENKKYAKWYDNLIQKAVKREAPGGYYEVHHIIPKSFGGADSKNNLVNLTAREHYIAHLLLWKMKFAGLYHSKMAYAMATFFHGTKYKRKFDLKMNSRMYESFKIDYADQVRIYQSGENNPFYGKKHSEETRKIIGEKSKQKTFKSGPDNPQWGKKLDLTPEQRKAKSDAGKALWADPEYKQEMLEKRKIFFASEKGQAQAKAFGDRNRGVKLSAERVEKSASKKRGKKAEEIFSPEALKNIAEGRKHRVYKPETAKARDEMIREIGKRPKTEEHKKKISEAVKRTLAMKKQKKLDSIS